MRKFNGILTIFTLTAFFLIITFFCLSAYGSEGPKPENYYFPFDKDQEAKGADAYIIARLEQIIELLGNDKDVGEGKEVQEVREVRNELVKLKASQDVWNSEIYKKVNVIYFFVNENAKLSLALELANKKLEEGASLAESYAALKKENEELKVRPKGISQEEGDRLTDELNKKDKIIAEKDEKIAQQFSRIKRLNRALAEKEEAEEPKFFRPYASLGAVDFIGPSKFEIAKWLNDEDSRFEHQIGGEVGFGLIIKQIVFAQGYLGLSGDNSDKHAGLEAGLCLWGLKIGGGVMNFCGTNHNVIYASSDGLFAPFVRVQPDKKARFIQFGLNVNFDILSTIERIR